jgi:hypothetical protein
MPTLKHQAIIQILRDEPQLVTALLGHIGFVTPSGSYPVIADSDLSHRRPGLLVIATSGAASDGSAEPIEIGQPDFRFRPFVVGGRQSLPAPRVLVGSCRDMDQLELWAARAATASTIDDVFAGASIAQDPARHWAPVVFGWSLT